MNNRLKSLSNICAVAAIVDGVLGFLGYMLGMGLLGSIREEYIPMAPSTAISFILLGFVLLFLNGKSLSQIKISIILVSTILVSLFGVLAVAQYFTGLDFSFENILVPSPGDLNGIPIARMSPATGAGFFLSGIAILSLLINRKSTRDSKLNEYFGGGLSAIILLVSFVFCLAYLYGATFLYERGAAVSMALTTMLGFGFIAVALLTARIDAFPMQVFAGSTIRGFLLGFILPLTILAVVPGGLIGRISGINPVYIAIAFTVSVAVLTGYAATVMSRHIGQKIDSSKAATMEAHRELLKSEDKFRSIFHSVTVGVIIVVDAKGNIQEWNQGAQKVFGYSVSEVAGESLTMLMPERFMKNHTKGLGQMVKKGALSHPNETHEMFGVRKNGQEFPLEFALGNWEINGRIYISAFMLDISERKYAQKALRQSDDILHEVGSIVLLAEKDGGIVYASPSIEKLAGYTPDEIMGDKWWSMSFIEEQTSIIRKNRIIEYAMDATLGYIEPYRRQVKCKDGSIKWFEWTISKGTEDTVISVGHEVTLRVNAENNLKEKTKELEMFFYRSAHDLRAPFSTSAGLINLIEQTHPNDEVLSYVRNLRLTLNKAEALISDLTLASMVSGAKLKLQPIDFDKLIVDIMQTISGTDSFDAIDFEFSVNLSRKFTSSSQLLSAILQNLLQNSINYHRPAIGNHAPIITIKVSSYKQGIKIRVHDNGQGICESHIDKIFDMYHRATAIATGTGLGLYIVKNAVENLDGKIKVRSELNKGTQFEILLPEGRELSARTSNSLNPGRAHSLSV